MSLTFILGGARSGKSAYALREAEAQAEEDGRRLVMIATAEALDGEMAERIDRHRAERSAAWTTIEAPRDLAGALGALTAGDVAVVDCLTLWLSNLMHDGADIAAMVAQAAGAMAASPAAVIALSNEVGQGIVPDNPLARRYRDEAGRMHQVIAAAAGRVVLITAGLPSILKG